MREVGSYISIKSKRAYVAAGDISTFIVIPPDGGWGWVVVITAFVTNLVVDGAMMTYGIFKISIQESLQCSDSQIILPSSVMTACFFFTGPFGCAMANKLGFRWTGIFGGVVAAVGYYLSTVVQGLALFILVYGGLCGVGFSLLYIASVVCVGFYFEKWRALSTSLACCGSAVGCSLFPIIFNGIFKTFDWKTKHIIIAISCGVCAILNIAYKPIKPVQVISADDKKKKPITILTSISSIDFEAEQEKYFIRFHNLTYPTNAEIHTKGVILIDDAFSSHGSKISVRQARTTRSHKSARASVRTALRDNQSHLDAISVMAEESGNYNILQMCALKIKAKCCWCCIREVIPSRPMYRDDILFANELNHLKQYAKAEKSLDYHLNVTRITTQDDVEESFIPCVLCPESVKRTLATMLDVSLITLPPFVLLNISVIFSIFGYFTPYLYLTESCLKNGMDETFANLILTVVGAANAIGRILGGILSSLPNLKVVPIVTWGMILAGLSQALLAVSLSSIFIQYICAIFYGIFISFPVVLRAIVMVDLLGIENFSNALGINMMVQGASCLGAIPFGGFLLEKTNFQILYIFSGCSISTGGILMLAFPALSKHYKNKIRS